LISDPARQHTLRHPRPRYDAPRAANTTDHQAALAGRLTARDRWILHMLHEHRVLTTHHLTALAFPSPRAARLRLRELYLWSVLDRFHPHTPTGSAPGHYVLGPAGAAVLAAEHGIDPAHFGYRRDRVNALAHSLRLTHTLGVNTWFTTLTTTTAGGAAARAVRPNRTRSGMRLTVWWSEARCARHFGDLTRPDAYGRLTTTPHTTTGAARGSGGREFEFFLEYDTGTEPLTRLARKLPGYAALADATGITTPLLLWLPTARREAAARQRLTRSLTESHTESGESRVLVATAAADLLDPADPHAGPADAVWFPLLPTHYAGRLPLARLVDAWPFLPPLTSSSSAGAAVLDPDAAPLPTPAGGWELPPPSPQPPRPGR
jgi:hypothetical protein